jgi:hypothetical protein
MPGYSLHLKNNINKLNDRLKRDKSKRSKSNTKMNNTIIYDKKIGKNLDTKSNKSKIYTNIFRIKQIEIKQKNKN